VVNIDEGEQAGRRGLGLVLPGQHLAHRPVEPLSGCRWFVRVRDARCLILVLYHVLEAPLQVGQVGVVVDIGLGQRDVVDKVPEEWLRLIDGLGPAAVVVQVGLVGIWSDGGHGGGRGQGALPQSLRGLDQGRGVGVGHGSAGARRRPGGQSEAVGFLLLLVVQCRRPALVGETFGRSGVEGLRKQGVEDG